MTISYNWLRQYLHTDLSPDKLSEMLTAIGLEVEEIQAFESVPGGLKGLVIGHVLSCEKHPDADKLSVTRVDIGTEELQIVCGAPNVAAGQKVVVATVGSELQTFSGEKISIKKAKIRGVESFGMICAEDEIGIGESHAGIMILPETVSIGMPAADYFGVSNDTLFEIGLTPNRADANSHIGVARDLYAVLNAVHGFDTALNIPDTAAFEHLPKASAMNPFQVELIAPEACTRYSGIALSGLKVAPSPDWLQNYLKAIGLKPVNNIVDATNYVLHAYGQPLHAFDAEKIGGKKIRVQFANAGAAFRTLDNSEVKLEAADLMICDQDQAMCIAGVYGGLNSGVSQDTHSIFLESACFSPVYIRRTAGRLNLRTDAATHFEKGTDPNATIQVLKSAAILIHELAGGEIASPLIDIYPVPVKEAEIPVSYAHVRRLIGKDIEAEKIQEILNLLGIEIVNPTAEGFMARVPTFKNEVTREADIIEEVLRIYGLNNIPMPAKLRSSLSFSEGVTRERMEQEVAKLLVSNGFYEIMTNTVSQSKYYDHASEEEKASLVKLLNSQTAELDVMRRSMIYSGLEVLSYNLNRKNNRIRFYEIGKSYYKKGDSYGQSGHLSLYLAGPEWETNWYRQAAKSDFFQLKSRVELILERFGVRSTQAQVISHERNLEYGIRFMQGNAELAILGKVAKKTSSNFGIKEEVFYAELPFEKIWELFNKNKATYKPVTKFPSVRRDLALVLDEESSFAQIEQIAVKEAGKYLRDITLFDVYRGDKIAEGKKSYAVSFLFENDQKTLTDQEIDKITGKLLNTFAQDLNASLRK